MPASKKKIIIDLLRHGEPAGGEVLRGRIDHELTELGWQQMRAAAGRVPESEPPWNHVVTSPLQRCRAFAERIAKDHNLPIAVEAGWQEIDYGEWDGMPLTVWRQQAAAHFQAFRKDMSKLVPPGGEDFISFKNRVLQAWEQLARLPDASHVLVITHGGVLRVVLPTVLGMPLNQSQPLHIPFASLSRVSITIDANSSQASLILHNGAA